jgi:hypothetical protein
VSFVAKLHDATLNALLRQMVAPERRHERLIEQIEVLDVLAERGFDVARLVESRGSFEDDVRVLQRFQSLHDVGGLAALGALNHELVDVERHEQDGLAGPVETIASEAQEVVVHLLERRPILHARPALAGEAVLLHQVRLSLLLSGLREHRPIILGHHRASWNLFQSSQHDDVAVVVARHAWIARVIEEGDGRVESAADEGRRAGIVLALVLELGNLVSVELHHLQVVVHQRADVVEAKSRKSYSVSRQQSC